MKKKNNDQSTLPAQDVLRIKNSGHTFSKFPQAAHHGKTYIIHLDDDGNEVGRAEYTVCRFVSAEFPANEEETCGKDVRNGLQINSRLYFSTEEFRYLHAGCYKILQTYDDIPEWADISLIRKYQSYRLRHPQMSSASPAAARKCSGVPKLSEIFDTKEEMGKLSGSGVPASNVRACAKLLLSDATAKSSVLTRNIAWFCIDHRKDWYRAVEYCNMRSGVLRQMEKDSASMTDLVCIYTNALAAYLGMPYMRMHDMSMSCSPNSLNRLLSALRGTPNIRWTILIRESYCRFAIKDFDKKILRVSSELDEKIRKRRYERESEMDLVFERTTCQSEDGSSMYKYTLSYGNSSQQPCLPADKIPYCSLNAMLWEENTGLLQEYVESIVGKLRLLNMI